jgi:Tfp pilus assembly protein PilE
MRAYCKTNSKSISRLSSQVGMSLMEIVVIMTVLSLVALGTTQMLKQLVQGQKESNVKEALFRARANIIRLIENDNTWAQTITAYPFGHPLGCMRDNSTTECSPGVYNQNFDVRCDPECEYMLNGTLTTSPIYYAGGTNSTGISPEGHICTGFNTGAGSDACPYRYNFVIEHTCPTGQPTCKKPRVLIRGNLVVNPASRGGPLSRINTENPEVDNQSMSFIVRRGSHTRYEPFVIRHFSTSNAASQVFGGQCPPPSGTPPLPTPIPRRLEVGGYDPNTDMGGSVLEYRPAQNSFRLRKGDYECTISAQAYGLPNGFRITLRETVGGPNRLEIPVGAAYTPAHATGELNSNIKFSLSRATWLQIIQYCSNGFTPSNANMGVATPVYTDGYSFTILSCVRIS